MPDRSPSDSISALFGRLVADTRAFVSAQIALYRTQIDSWLAQAKVIAIFAVVALVLVNAAVIALFVGLLLTLQPRVGPGWATVIVVAGTLAVAGLLGWLAATRVRRLVAGGAVK